MCLPGARPPRTHCAPRIAYRGIATPPLCVGLHCPAQVPHSVALPFGTFERVLKAPANAATAAKLQQLLKQLGGTGGNGNGKGNGNGGVPAELAKVRALVSTQLAPPPELIQVGSWVKKGLG